MAASSSTRSVQLVRQNLARAIRHAEVHDLVVRNVATLATIPRGKPGRPSKSLTLVEATALLDAAKSHRLNAYVVVSLLCGLRTEEMRAVRWADVDLQAETVAVYRSVRAAGDVKTRKSRRMLKLPELAAQALRDHLLIQARERRIAGSAWQEDSDLVFASQVGTPLDASHVRRAFKSITEAAGLGRDWCPRDLRHSFVSLLSDSGVTLENIADAVGHAGTRTTEGTYRHQLKPVLLHGATAMDALFKAS